MMSRTWLLDRGQYIDDLKTSGGRCMLKDLLDRLFLGMGPVPPGAVFIMLEKSPTKGCSSYGKLFFNRTGYLLFNGREIKDLTTLIQNCLAGSCDA